MMVTRLKRLRLIHLIKIHLALPMQEACVLIFMEMSGWPEMAVLVNMIDITKTLSPTGMIGMALNINLNYMIRDISLRYPPL